MTHSLYGSFAPSPDCAAGYTKGEKGAWENAPYLSMAQPYAAGSLMSNVTSGEVGCRRVCGKAAVGCLMGEGVYGVSPDHWRGYSVPLRLAVGNV